MPGDTLWPISIYPALWRLRPLFFFSGVFPKFPAWTAFLRVHIAPGCFLLIAIQHQMVPTWLLSQMPSSDALGIPCCLLCLILFINCVTFDIFYPCIVDMMRVLSCHPGWLPPRAPSALASWVTRVTAPAHSTASWFYCGCLFNMKVCSVWRFIL